MCGLFAAQWANAANSSSCMKWALHHVVDTIIVTMKCLHYGTAKEVSRTWKTLLLRKFEWLCNIALFRLSVLVLTWCLH